MYNQFPEEWNKLKGHQVPKRGGGRPPRPPLHHSPGEARQTTDIVDFLSKNEQDQMNEHGYNAMQSYLDPKKDVIETLLKRAQNVQYMLNIWESKCQEKLGKPP